MAPKRGESVEQTEEHEEFMKKLAEYHEKRGTNLDSEAKVGVRHIDLLKLYKRVVDEGGYDHVSDTKAKPLMWRRLAEEFVGKNQYTAAQAFQIKNVYYKNLCAYEISKHWDKEPPAKEILEEVTAKGGNVMTRTLENFARPPTKEEMNLGAGGGGEGSDASPEQRTPKFEKTADDVEDPGSASGRTTRGLRQAPPQRVLFQPDLTSGRQTRGTLNSTNSPTPGAGPNGLHTTAPTMVNGSGAASSTLASYEPSQSYPLSLKPVITPANNPDYYRQQLKRKAESAMGPLAKKYKNIMLPGTGFIGPNIYVRAQLALQSGMEEEECYALHHLVKISHERGDKYRFDQFPGLAEALTRKCLGVCGLFYDVEWDVSYDEETMDTDEEMLDGLRGTPDILRRLKGMIPKVTDDGMQDPPFLSQLNRIMEAGLVLRNMCLQSENAKYLVNIPMMRDYLAVVLNLPQHPGIVELQHYALDTAEQLLVWWDLGPRDAVYQALIAQLYGQDRGAIVIALRAIARTAMNLTGPKRLDDVPAAVLRKVQSWLLVEDEEMRSACLDFLFQYTSFADNVDTLLRTVDAEALAHHLSRLLLFATKEERKPGTATEVKEDKSPQPVPRLSKSVVELLLTLDEPERSSEWLRMCFVADRESDMTQISLWQAYQATFAPHNTPTRSHLVAGEFIKNVSTTFLGATAQVAGGNKYVIRGIRARRAPVETGVLDGSRKGRELKRCCWTISVPAEPSKDPVTGVQFGPATREVECGEWFRGGGSMSEHVLRDHLGVPRKQQVAASVATPAADVAKMEVDSTAPTSRPARAMAMANGHANGNDNGTPAPTAPPKTLTELFDFPAADTTTHRCRWAGCNRSSLDFDTSSQRNISRTALFARHIQTHLPDADLDAARAKHNRKPADAASKVFKTMDKVVLQGLVDEKGDAWGVPLSAALVMRNLGKFMPRHDIPGSSTVGVAPPLAVEDGVPTTATDILLNSGVAKTGGDGMEEGGLMAKVFDEEVVERLFFALTHFHVPWHYVKNWNPIKIDALGLVTLLGAEEVGQAVGSLEKRRLTGYLHLLGAFVIAEERFPDQQLGYTLYVIDDGVQTTQLNGWFTRWAAAQRTKDATTIFRWRLAETSGPRASAWDSLALVIIFAVVVPLLPCTVLVGDWWGVPNWVAIFASIWVRVALLWQIRQSLEPHCAPHETKKGWELEHRPLQDEIKIMVVRPDGRMFTILTTREFLPAFSCRVPSEPPSTYRITAYVGWLAFGVHACTRGMCTLMTQIYTVVLLVGSTWLNVKRFDSDILTKTHASADWGGGISIGRRGMRGHHHPALWQRHRDRADQYRGSTGSTYACMLMPGCS